MQLNFSTLCSGAQSFYAMEQRSIKTHMERISRYWAAGTTVSQFPHKANDSAHFHCCQGRGKFYHFYHGLQIVHSSVTKHSYLPTML
jgi:hypothetical protein